MPEMKVFAGRGVRAAMEEACVGEMRVLGKEGDTRLTWNARDTDEVDAVRKQFDELRGKRFKAYAVAEDGGKGTEITEFDPNAQKIIMAPPMAGGA
jgi:hypothetical protein